MAEKSVVAVVVENTGNVRLKPWPSSRKSVPMDTFYADIQAGLGFGVGTYTQALGVSLVVPADSRAGTYTASLTVTAAAAP